MKSLHRTMPLTLVSGPVSAIQVARELGYSRPTTYFRIAEAPARMRRAGHLPISEKDHVTACGLMKRDYFQVLAVYNHKTDVLETMPTGRHTAGIILIFLIGAWLIVQESMAAKALGVVFWAGAVFAAWYVRRATQAARKVSQHVARKTAGGPHS